MTRPIHTFQDILDAMAQDPQLEQAMRRHVLGPEFLQLPAIVRELQQAVAELTQTVQDYIAATDARLESIENRLTRIEGDIVEMKGDIVEMKGDIVEMKGDIVRIEGDIVGLKAGQARMEGTLNRLSGTDYERKVARRSGRLARRRLAMTSPQTVYAVTLPDQAHIPDLLDQAVGERRISEAQADDLEETDLILVDRSNSTYALAEVSLTLDAEDARRARRRADTLATASGQPVQATVIGVYALDECRQAASEHGVTVITLPE